MVVLQCGEQPLLPAGRFCMMSPVGVHHHGRGIRYKGNHGDGEYKAPGLIRSAHSNTVERKESVSVDVACEAKKVDSGI